MFKTAAVLITFVFCATGASTSKRAPRPLSGFASAAAMALGLATFVPANPALAATFATTDAATITMTGKIDVGDEQKFFAALSHAPNFRKLVVNSPGGSIVPAYLIGQVPAHRLLRSSGRPQRCMRLGLHASVRRGRRTLGL